MGQDCVHVVPKSRSCNCAKRSERLLINGKIINGDEKECLTTPFMVNAAGTMVPPMVMYCYQRIPSSVTQNVPLGWSIGTSERGWMTAETFYEYITNVFYPWLQKKSVEFSIILFVDGHSSHLTLPLSNFVENIKSSWLPYFRTLLIFFNHWMLPSSIH